MGDRAIRPAKPQMSVATLPALRQVVGMPGDETDKPRLFGKHR